jgi:hypothetical protein
MDQASNMGKGAIALGVVGLLIACLGCATGKFKNPCFAIPYGLLSFIITIIFLVVGLIAMAVSSETGQTTIFELACGLTVTGAAAKLGNTVKNPVDLADLYKNAVDKPICSIFCPCDATSVFDPTALPNTKLITYGRYVDASSNAAAYNSGSSKYYTPKSGEELQALIWAAPGSSTKTYASYQDCYKNVLGPASANDEKASATKKKIDKFIQSGGFDFLK